ncbi:MAG: YqeG family HAD IIIA-type phosphatase [Ruminococcus sp.]|nr:YqeG family HAD IIIA-type phosphatase [Ruminococcus sp.]
MLFRATEYFRKITDISPDFLVENNVKGIILDIDNTLTTHDNPVPAEGVTEWLEQVRKKKIKLVIVSNNHPPRVMPFAESLGIKCICEGKKPLTTGFKQALEWLGIPKKNVVAIGDQIFTDVLGANLFGIRMLYTAPIELEKTTFFKVKRTLEKPFLPKKFH